jgi:Permuted papain-like amidase enzyme, YaeF/YiiX, C92 family
MSQTATVLMPGSARMERLPEEIRLGELERKLRIGDLIFIRIPWSPFRQIATLTGTWTNHVGIVSDIGPAGAIIAESRFPISCRTSFTHFMRRSERGRVAVSRLPRPLSDLEIRQLQRAVAGRLGQVYDTGFNLRSRRQFCSRFVHEVLLEATGEELGRVITFKDLLADNAETDLRLWQFWYFGRIPWTRLTITPASLYLSEALRVVFDGEIQRELGEP